MGDPHHNVWGDKNNSWGNRNRKKEETVTRYEPNKLFNTLAAGFLIFLCGAAGLSVVSNLFLNAKDAIDKTNTVKEVIQNNPINSVGHGDSTILDKLIKAKIDDMLELDEQQVADILNTIADNFSKNGITANVENIVILDYKDVSTDKLYKENIINNLSKYSNAVTFAVVGESYSQSTFEDKVSILQQLAADNINELSSVSNFKQITTGGSSNTPLVGNFTFLITFQ